MSIVLQYCLCMYLSLSPLDCRETLIQFGKIISVHIFCPTAVKGFYGHLIKWSLITLAGIRYFSLHFTTESTERLFRSVHFTS